MPHKEPIAPLLLTLASFLVAWCCLPFSNDVALTETAEEWYAGRSQDKIAVVAALLTPPLGFSVNAYAIGLGQARMMALTPAGDIIVSSPPSRVLLVKADRNGDGRADGVETLIDGLENPSGIFLDQNLLYVAEEPRVFRVRFDVETGHVSGSPETMVADIPHGGMHWTRTIKKGPDGFFYVSIGSSCDVCIEKNPWLASIIRFKPGGKPALFASGLRNTVGFDWQPGTGDLYGVDNGRNGLGDDFPPEELNHISQGGFYGWPYLNGDNVPDPDFGGQDYDRAANAIPPAYRLSAHVAPLSILFLRHTEFSDLANTALVAEHGSSTRSQKDGYRVVALSWRNDTISEMPFLTGFLQGDTVLGRPVGIIEAEDGTIFISDDFNGVIWQVAQKTSRDPNR
jgi:glucose/arabinose dehydrogenase